MAMRDASHPVGGARARWLLGLGVAAGLGLAASSLLTARHPGSQLPKGAVAIVNGTPPTGAPPSTPTTGATCSTA
jgi:hypothetical protein